jgi:hypothetical protein
MLPLANSLDGFKSFKPFKSFKRLKSSDSFKLFKWIDSWELGVARRRIENVLEEHKGTSLRFLVNFWPTLFCSEARPEL